MARWMPGQGGMGGWWPATPCPESHKCWSNSVTVSSVCSPPPLKPGKWTSTGGAPGKPQERVPTVTVQRTKRQCYQEKREKGFIYYTSHFKAPRHAKRHSFPSGVQQKGWADKCHCWGLGHPSKSPSNCANPPGLCLP